LITKHKLVRQVSNGESIILAKQSTNERKGFFGTPDPLGYTYGRRRSICVRGNRRAEQVLASRRRTELVV
jgi:hypothetical protein